MTAAALLGSAEVCETAGITYRQLDYWTRCGVIRPAAIVDPHGGPVACDQAWPGSGRRRRFTGRQAAILAACGALARLCADTGSLRALVDACEGIEMPAVVAVDGDGQAFVLDDGRAPAVACWLVPVGTAGSGR